MKVIFLDRDETINEDPGYINDPQKIKFKKNAIVGLSLLKEFGYQFIIVSNQSGIGRKLITNKQLKKVNQRLIHLLKKENIFIKDIFICPHLPEDNCDCRKPKDGLILQALKKYKKINLKKSYIIGDKLRDIASAEKQKVAGILLDTNLLVEEGNTDISKVYIPSNLIHQCEDLKEASEFILERKFNQSWNSKISKTYKKKKFLKQILKIKQKKKKLVFTNGCFDILHPGHIQYLKQAKALGDLLVVGLNSDASVKRLKGKGRPVNTLSDRLLMLANYDFIDFVVGFDEDTPIECIQKIQPDIHIKGGDYKKEDLPEYEVIKKYGGDVVILPFRKGYSTSAIVNKLKK